ncbi:PDR/VanB family oxidoreductase [Marinobacterium lutimaris]|uniref:Vanillate O-demethylase ferredoxin subunit n=1 Tax=Marinobacterium lutimaris TaxID=568106 RepID=A0A1H5WJ97_9GAMM|nr:PDR/VanB family oxidoreductase [Marinobacterium lutimaris]SEF99370.1 vanillate O-demethylase ferredoxin subunit [Marinobacterium lutimaris]
MNTWIVVQVEEIRHVSKGVVNLTLIASDGMPLPIAPAGSHIDLRLPNGVIRQYSVHDCSDGRYHLGIGLAESSRGGSLFVHGRLTKGDTLEASPPRNLFALDYEAEGFLFIAGGIGITPILSMVRWCKAHNRPWKLLYSGRSRDRMAYIDEVNTSINAELHFSEESGSHPDIQSYIKSIGPKDHLYCCGPGPMMDSVESFAEGLIDSDRLHFERFKAPEPASSNSVTDKSFKVTLSSSGKTIEVPPHLSLLEALESEGISIPFSCREGMCRTCECRVLEGKIDHRDYVLSDSERESNEVVLPCVSRAESDSLIIEA